MEDIKEIFGQISVILGYLPYYFVSTVFRILSIVIFFTYLNLWAFVSPSILLFLNFIVAHCIDRDYNIDGARHAFLVAIAGVFTPLCVFKPIKEQNRTEEENIVDGINGENADER